MTRAHLVAVLVLVTALVACPSEEAPPPEDAGQEAFVRRVVPLVWGRPAQGVAEVRVLVDLADRIGRAELVRAMANDPAWDARWEDWLMDTLAVNRIGRRSKEECWGLSVQESADASVAQFVRDHPPTDEAAMPWTMIDLVRSSLVLDDLSPLWHATLFANLAPPQEPPNQAEALAQREDLLHLFTRTYLHRSLDCMPCHNSEFSVTGRPDPERDRTWEIPGLWEKALFGESAGRPIDDVSVLFRRHGVLNGFLFVEETRAIDGCFPRNEPGCEGCQCEEEVCAEDPSCCEDVWGEQCADLCRGDPEEGETEDPFLNNNCVPALPENFDGCTPLTGYLGCGGCACEAEVCEQNPLCCERGWSVACADACRYYGYCEETGEPDPSELDGLAPWGMYWKCGRFDPADEATVDPLQHDPYFIEDLPPTGNLWDLQAAFGDGVAALRAGGPPSAGDQEEVDGEVAFAWLWSTHVADSVWEEANGQSLTLPNWFPRNEAQLNRLWGLADTFVQHDFSLTELVVAVVTDPTFNAPAPNVYDADAWTPYEFGRVWNPWAREQVDEELQLNSVGDAVHRHPPRLLIHMIHTALNWPPLEPWPQSEPAEQYRPQEDLGLFLKDSLPGFSGTNMQAMAAWEEHYGRCTQPSGVDWIDRLMTDGTAAEATVGQAVQALKDRLLADPTIDEDERALLAAVVGAGWSEELTDEYEDGLRWACGVFLATPQFQLAGLAPATILDGEEIPSPGLYLVGMSYADRCEALSDSMFGGALTCENGSLSVD